MNSDIFGPPQPLTIGLTAIGFLCISFRKYACCVLGSLSCLSVRYSCVVWSMIPFLHTCGQCTC